MLKSLHLTNFKCFGEQVCAPFAPITVVFGENGAGKSSLIQSLLLLKQSYEYPSTDSELTLTSSLNHVDLGTCHNLCFQHNKSKPLIIRIDFVDTHNHDRRQSISSVGAQYLFDIVNDNVKLNRLYLFADTLNDPLFVFTCKTMDDDKRRKLLCSAPFRMRGAAYIPSDVADLLQDRYAFYDESDIKSKRIKLSYLSCIKANIHLRILDDIVNDIEMLTQLNNYLGKQLEQSLPDENDDFMKSIRIDMAHLKEYIESRDTFNIKILLIGLIVMMMFLLFKIGYLTLLPFEVEGLRVSSFIPNLLDEKSDSLDDIRHINNKIHDCTYGILRTYRKLFEEFFSGLFYIGPFRVKAARHYDNSMIDSGYVGQDGCNVPFILHNDKKLLKQVNYWMDKIGIGYQISTKQLRSNNVFEYNLKDTRISGHPVISFSDAGFGVSQLLPFIVQSVMSKNSAIVVSQPELHIHPRLQADIGTIIMHSYKEQNNQFIIETHSEHLLLRLLKYVRTKQLKPQDISILFVGRGKNGSQIQQIRIDENGNMIDNWPGGFFPERFNELFGE